MNDAREILFGKFSRPVGNPNQHFVHSRPEFDAFIEANLGENNLYSGISHYTPNGVAVADKVSLDFDSPRKESSFPMAEAEDEKIDMMRQDPDLAIEVLGDVLDETKRVANWCMDQEIPALGVFTGFGIHIHLLYQGSVYPTSELISTAVMLKEELDLETLDRRPIGDPHRLMRIPNCERVYKNRPCRLWTIPLTLSEIVDLTVPDLLEESKSPKYIDSVENSRGEMQVYEDYTRSNAEDIHKKPVKKNEDLDLDDDYIEWLLKEALKLPCMYERIMQPDPDQPIRFNCTVMLMNYGLEPNEIFNIYKKLRWVDWDPELTKYQINNIWQGDYADMSCESIESHGYCVFEKGRREEECPTYRWSGGNQEY